MGHSEELGLARFIEAEIRHRNKMLTAGIHDVVDLDYNSSIVSLDCKMCKAGENFTVVKNIVVAHRTKMWPSGVSFSKIELA